jgi:hypothetical protein
MSGYFNSFPAVQYNGTYATDLTLRAKFIEASRKINLTFYPYTIKEGERPDQIAYYYYDDPSFSWLVFLSNDIIDPYFEWPMSNDIFGKHIKSKYGSVYDSQQKIVKYVTNWYNDDRVITASAYAILPKNIKKYWAPETSTNAKTYVRKRTDLIAATNVIQTLEVLDTSIFTVGERITYASGSNVAASAEVVKASGTTLIIKHITGTFSVNPSYHITTKAGEETTITTVIDTHYVIPTSEMLYWSSISAYDEEEQLNESRKTIMLVDKGLKTQVARELNTLLANV